MKYVASTEAVGQGLSLAFSALILMAVLAIAIGSLSSLKSWKVSYIQLILAACLDDNGQTLIRDLEHSTHETPGYAYHSRCCCYLCCLTLVEPDGNEENSKASDP
jgi:hypothetical protein